MVDTTRLTQVTSQLCCRKSSRLYSPIKLDLPHQPVSSPMHHAVDNSMMQMMLRTMATMIQTGNMQPPVDMVPIQYTHAQSPSLSSTVPVTPLPSAPLPIAPRITASELAFIDDEPWANDDADDDAFGNMEELMKDAAGKKKETVKRPGAATKQRPAVATMKRPAVATMKKPTKPGTIIYKDSTIYSSDYKGGYRVLLPGEKRIDKLFRWSAFKSRAEALSHIKGIIDKMST